MIVNILPHSLSIHTLVWLFPRWSIGGVGDDVAKMQDAAHVQS